MLLRRNFVPACLHRSIFVVLPWLYILSHRVSTRSALYNPYAWVPALCLLLYSLHAVPDPTNYFHDLADAFLHGQLHLRNPSNTHDLVIFGGRHYLYWPPVPALVFMPLVAIWGPVLSDNLVGALVGTANVWLLMQCCRALSQRCAAGLQSRDVAALGLFWGLGTVHFYLTSTAEVWYISQIMAQTWLLAAVLCFLSGRSMLLSGLFFALAAYTRNDLVFAGFFFFALHRILLPQRRGVGLLKDALLFAAPFVACSVLNGWYNWARFGDAFENGLQYHQMSHHFAEDFRRYGYFSLHYLRYNFYVEVLHAPTLISKPPFIQLEEEGFGFLWASPLFFLLLPTIGLWLYHLVAARRGVPSSYWWLSGGSMAAAVPIALTIFLIMGTGWVQFGARYTLDFQAFLLFFLLAAWPALQKFRWMRPLCAALILLSVAVQAVGAGQGHWWG